MFSNINLSKKKKMGSTKTVVDTTGRTLFAHIN